MNLFVVLILALQNYENKMKTLVLQLAILVLDTGF